MIKKKSRRRGRKNFRFSELERNKPQRNFLPLVMGISFVLVFGLLYGILNILRVNVISVAGGETLSQGEVIEKLDLAGFRVILFLDKEEIAEKMYEQFPILEDVQVKKSLFPNTLTISVREKRPVVAWNTGRSILGIDRDGYVLEYLFEHTLPLVYDFGVVPIEEQPHETEAFLAEESDEHVLDADIIGEASPFSLEGGDVFDAVQEEQASMQIAEYGEQMTSKDYIEYIIGLHDNLPGIIHKDILYFYEGESRDIGVKLSDGMVVWFNTRFVLYSELSRLEATLREIKHQQKTINEYVDLRFERVYFK